MRQQRAGEVAGASVHGPSAMRSRHDLPDRVEDVGVGAELEDRAQERRGEVGLADAGREPRLHLGHGLLGDAQRVAQAGELVRRLDSLGRADHLAARRRRPVGEQRSRLAAHRVGPLVDATVAWPARRSASAAAKSFDALVEVEVGRAVQVVVVEVELAGRSSATNGREQVGRLVVGEDDGDRAARSWRGRRRSAARWRRWRTTTLALPSSTSASMPWSPISDAEPRARSRRIRVQVRLRREVETGRAPMP